MFQFIKIKNNRFGQAVVVAILTIGITLLGATAFAGVIMANELRAAGSVPDSANAIFIADSGVNWALYSYLTGKSVAQPGVPSGESLLVTCFDSTGAALACTSPDVKTVVSKGTSVGGSRRAFLLDVKP